MTKRAESAQAGKPVKLSQLALSRTQFNRRIAIKESAKERARASRSAGKHMHENSKSPSTRITRSNSGKNENNMPTVTPADQGETSSKPKINNNNQSRSSATTEDNEDDIVICKEIINPSRVNRSNNNNTATTATGIRIRPEKMTAKKSFGYRENCNSNKKIRLATSEDQPQSRRLFPEIRSVLPVVVIKPIQPPFELLNIVPTLPRLNLNLSNQHVLQNTLFSSPSSSKQLTNMSSNAQVSNRSHAQSDNIVQQVGHDSDQPSTSSTVFTDIELENNNTNDDQEEMIEDIDDGLDEAEFNMIAIREYFGV